MQRCAKRPPLEFGRVKEKRRRSGARSALGAELGEADELECANLICVLALGAAPAC